MENKAKIIITADADQLQAGLRKASAALDQFKSGAVTAISGARTAFIGMTAATTAFAGVAFIASINNAVDSLARLDDMAQKTGSSVENLSRLEQVAAATGAAFNGVDGALDKLAKNLATVNENGSDTAAALAAIGISQKDIVGKDTAGVFVLIAKSLQEYKDGAGKVAIANQLMGRSGAELLPYLNDVAEKVDQFQGHSAAAAKMAADYQDAMSELNLEFTNLAISIASDALPAATEFIKRLNEIANASDQSAGSLSFGKTAVDGLTTSFEAITVLGYEVMYTFRGIGREIGATAAQAVALASLDFAGANAIGEALIADNDQAIKEREAFLKRLLEGGSPASTIDVSGSDHRLAGYGRSSGLKSITVPNASAAEAAAKKALDAQRRIDDNYAQQSISLSKEIAKSETIIANIRAGILEDDGQHVAAIKEWLTYDKEGIQLDQARKDKLIERAVLTDKLSISAKIEKEHAAFMLQAEQDRLKAERDIASIRLTGESARYSGVEDWASTDSAQKLLKYDPGKYYQEYAVQVARVEREKNTVAAQYVYSLQEQEKALSRQIKLLGLSSIEQEKQQALWQAEDAFKKSIQGMDESDLAYQEQKTAYLQQQADITASIEAKRNWERDPAAQSVKALQDYADQATNIGQQVAGAWQNSFDGMADSLTNFLTTGKGSFSDFATSVIQDIIRIQMRSSVTGPLASALSGYVSSAFTNWSTPSNANTTIPMQPGGGYAGGGAIYGPGTSTSDSILAWLSNGEYVVKASAVNRVGVDFLDAINSGKNLRKYATGGLVTASSAASNGVASGSSVQVNVINQTNQQVSAEASQPRFDGEKMIVDVVLKKIATDRNFRQAVRGTA